MNGFLIFLVVVILVMVIVKFVFISFGVVGIFINDFVRIMENERVS